MNGKPNVEPAWMSLKRLVETRMIEILRKEQDNKRYIRLYGTEDYWHAFEESAFQLERLFRKGETTEIRAGCFRSSNFKQIKYSYIKSCIV